MEKSLSDDALHSFFLLVAAVAILVSIYQTNGVKPYTANIFRNMFYSFGAGNANAISSSKLRKIFMFMRIYTFSKFVH